MADKTVAGLQRMVARQQELEAENARLREQIERAREQVELMRFAASTHEEMGNNLSAEGVREQAERVLAILAGSSKSGLGSKGAA